MKTNIEFLRIILLSILVSTSYAKRDEIFKGKTSIEKPFDLRDPFKAPRMKRQRDSGISSRIGNNVYDDSPNIDNVKISDLQITGVIIGSTRRAFAKAKGIKRVINLKEGMIVGENNAEIKAILPGGVILVEKTTNIYGEEEYLETVLPITN